MFREEPGGAPGDHAMKPMENIVKPCVSRNLWLTRPSAIGAGQIKNPARNSCRQVVKRDCSVCYITPKLHKSKSPPPFMHFDYHASIPGRAASGIMEFYENHEIPCV